MSFYNELVFTEAMEQATALVASDSSDEIAARLERIAGQPDLAHACLMLLTMMAKGIDVTTKTGVELANSRPSIADLILPPGVRL